MRSCIAPTVCRYWPPQLLLLLLGMITRAHTPPGSPRQVPPEPTDHRPIHLRPTDSRTEPGTEVLGGGDSITADQISKTNEATVTRPNLTSSRIYTYMYMNMHLCRDRDRVVVVRVPGVAPCINKAASNIAVLQVSMMIHNQYLPVSIETGMGK